MQVMAKKHSGGGSGEPLGALGKQVQFWTSFSEKMCGNPAVLHGLGAARNLLPAPLHNSPDRLCWSLLVLVAAEMVASPAVQTPPPSSTRAGGQDDGSYTNSLKLNLIT